jgi:hypothetical protein
MTVKNTAAMSDDEVSEFIREGIVVGPGRAIENMEARGQSQLVASSQLPYSGIYVLKTERPGETMSLVTPVYANDPPERRAAATVDPVWEKMGIVIRSITAGDPLFVDVTLPAGWKIVPMPDPRGSHLVDTNGRHRASIFYKAASYDRYASINVLRRFTVNTIYEQDPRGTRLGVFDGETLIFRTEKVAESGSFSEDEMAAREKNRTVAFAWLKERWPDHDNPLAYWDLPAVTPAVAPK